MRSAAEMFVVERENNSTGQANQKLEQVSDPSRFAGKLLNSKLCSHLPHQSEFKESFIFPLIHEKENGHLSLPGWHGRLMC